MESTATLIRSLLYSVSFIFFAIYSMEPEQAAKEIDQYITMINNATKTIEDHLKKITTEKQKISADSQRALQELKKTEIALKVKEDEIQKKEQAINQKIDKLTHRLGTLPTAFYWRYDVLKDLNKVPKDRRLKELGSIIDRYTRLELPEAAESERDTFVQTLQELQKKLQADERERTFKVGGEKKKS